MSPDVVVRDLIEGGIVVALGAMIVTAAIRLMRGEIKVNRCDACDRPFSRAYGHCPHCGGVRA